MPSGPSHGVEHDGHSLVVHGVGCHLEAGTAGLQNDLVRFLLLPGLNAVILRIVGIALDRCAGGAAGPAVQHDLGVADAEMVIAAADVDTGGNETADVGFPGFLAEHIKDHGADPGVDEALAAGILDLGGGLGVIGAGVVDREDAVFRHNTIGIHQAVQQLDNGPHSGVRNIQNAPIQQSVHQEMLVRVNKAGNDAGASGVNDPGLRSLIGQDLLIRAHGKDPTAVDGDRLGHIVIWVYRENASAADNEGGSQQGYNVAPFRLIRSGASCSIRFDQQGLLFMEGWDDGNAQSLSPKRWTRFSAASCQEREDGAVKKYTASPSRKRQPLVFSRT